MRSTGGQTDLLTLIEYQSAGYGGGGNWVCGVSLTLSYLRAAFAGQRIDRAEIVDQDVMLPQRERVRFSRREEGLRSPPAYDTAVSNHSRQ